MLQSRYRLRRDKDFALLARSRKMSFARTLGVKVRENQLPHSRFGIIVGMKVSKNAAERNLVKRRLREILRKRLAEIKSGHDVMVMASAQALGKSYQILEADVVTALKKAGMLKTT